MRQMWNWNDLLFCFSVNDFIIISANIEIRISEKISTTHITFIVNIYNMWWKGLELNFIIPTKIHNLPNWLMGPTSKRAAPQM